MPALLLHLTAVDRLAAHANTLPPEFARAVAEDVEYARFGAALPDLPWFGGVVLGVQAWFGRTDAPHFSRLLKERAPVAFGLKAADLVANGALVGTEAGLAFLAGYFTQLCVSRTLEPLAGTLVPRHRGPKESEIQARERIEWIWSLFYLEELHGGDGEELRLKLESEGLVMYAGVMPHLFPTEGVVEKLPNMWSYAFGHSLFLDVDFAEGGAQ